QDFLDVERPSGTVEGIYARIYSTLRLYDNAGFTAELAGRIIADGVRHYSRFSEIRAILGTYIGPHRRPDAPTITRKVEIKKDHTEFYKTVKEACDDLKKALIRAYETGDMEDADHITSARMIMRKLDGECERLATRGFGVPFDSFFP